MKSQFVLSLFLFSLVSFANSSPSTGKDADTIFKESIDGVVWINNHLPNGGVGAGSGVLVDGKRKLILTNAHILQGETEVAVHFSVNNQKGALEARRSYYEKNYEQLKLNRSSSAARLAAIDHKKDLAIMHVWVVPKWAKTIPIRSDASMANLTKGDLIHILGNPAGRDLWQWSLGTFETTYRNRRTDDKGDLDFKAISTQASIYFGNSGGAMLDSEGRLVGVTQSMSGEGISRAHGIHASEISPLLNTIKLKWVFTLKNSTRSDFHYMISGCGVAEDDEDAVLKPDYYIVYSCNTSEPVIKYWYTTTSGRRVDKNYEIGVSPLYVGDGVKAERGDSFEYEAKWHDGDLKVFRKE